mgnify:CR=1 FL=1
MAECFFEKKKLKSITVKIKKRHKGEEETILNKRVSEEKFVR